MKDNNKGISLIKLLIVFLILIIVVCSTYLFFGTNISQVCGITYDVVTRKINLDKEIEINEKLMGITDVTGPGITISILDGKDLIHQEDLIILIDELKNSGSQAISVNEQRITNSTYLYCDGSVILIDGEKIGNPFTIKAIGNSETIYGALTRNKGYLSTLKKDGIEITVEQSDEIHIPKTRNKTLLEYSNGLSKISSLKESNQLVGKADMTGDGMEIIIHETKAKLTALSFLQIINDLNSAGAKAISINGQRVVNMTDSMDISNTYVLLNSIPISAPYVIDVIGDSDKIEEAINYSNSYITKTREKGNGIEVYIMTNLKIDKYVQKKDKDKMSIDYLK